MTPEFDHVRASFAASRPAQALAAVRRAAETGWQTSWFRAAMRRAARAHVGASKPLLIRPVAIAVVVAAGLQPLFLRMMSPTVRPAIPPSVFVAIALLAVVAAWRPGEVATAWSSSHLARLLRR